MEPYDRTQRGSVFESGWCKAKAGTADAKQQRVSSDLVNIWGVQDEIILNKIQYTATTYIRILPQD